MDHAPIKPGQDRIVRRRRVFYIPGYDPLSPRRYRELFRTEALKQAGISGYSVKTEGLTGREVYSWQATGEIDGQRCGTLIEFLAWNDIVRDTLRKPILFIYLLMLRTFWRFLSCGALIAMIRLRPGPMLAGLAPVGFMLLYLIAAAASGWAALSLGLALGTPVWAGWLGAVAVFLGIMALTRRLDPVIYTYYLICDYGYVASEMGAYPAELAHRLQSFRARLENALEDDVDEVLVVGHSSGAHLAVSVLADLLRRRREAVGPELSLLTIGQAIPMTSFLPRATELRRDLAELSVSRRITWIDVSAMADGASFTLCDPVCVSGVAGPEKRWPKVISAAFSRTLSPERLRYLRWRYFLRHIQYLCAFDFPGEYDYFAITAGPLTLARRFRDRRPSPSREERVFSPHRSRA